METTSDRRARDYTTWWALLGGLAFAAAFFSKLTIEPDPAVVGVESFGGAGIFMLAATLPAGLASGLARLFGKRLEATQWLGVYTVALAAFCYLGWVLSWYQG